MAEERECTKCAETKKESEFTKKDDKICKKCNKKVMAKKPPKKIENKGLSNAEIKDKLGLKKQQTKDKKLSWLPYNDAFYQATGCPGVPRGYATQFRGFSDTGKSTAIYEAVVGAQQLGEYVVIIDTEGSWDWTHARDIGVEFFEEVNPETGEITYDIDGVYVSGKELLERFCMWDYKDGKLKTKVLRNIPVIEDVARFINQVFDLQDSGDIDRPVMIGWDSIGSISCYAGAISNTNNNMWNAGALNREFESILNFRIPASRRLGTEEKPNHYKTLVAVQKIWLDSSGMGQPIIKHKGGEGFRFGVRLIFHMGGKTTSSSRALKATSGGKDYQFGTQTKIEVFKCHLNIVTKKGEIVSTAHGFVGPDDIDAYKKEHKEYILEKLGGEFTDFDVRSEDIDPDPSDSRA